MSHQETHGNLVVDEGNEHPSKLNMEGQNAQHTSAAGNALPEAGPSRSRSNSNSNSVGQGEGDEKKEVGGSSKPQMEKYAYHSMFPSFFLLVLLLIVPHDRLPTKRTRRTG